MDDPAIRAALLSGPLACAVAAPDTLVRHELGLWTLAGDRRADLALIGPSEMSGWEIKSDQDSLGRLAGQVQAYNQVFDRATLVTTPGWLARGIAEKLPPWWGLLVAVPGPDAPGVGPGVGPGVDPGASPGAARVVVTVARAAGDNTGRVDPLALAALLWRDEVLEELRARGQARGLSRSPRRALWERLAAVTEPAQLRAVVRTRLRARRGWTGHTTDRHTAPNTAQHPGPQQNPDPQQNPEPQQNRDTVPGAARRGTPAAAVHEPHHTGAASGLAARLREAAQRMSS